MHAGISENFGMEIVGYQEFSKMDQVQAHLKNQCLGMPPNVLTFFHTIIREQSEPRKQMSANVSSVGWEKKAYFSSQRSWGEVILPTLLDSVYRAEGHMVSSG